MDEQREARNRDTADVQTADFILQKISYKTLLKNSFISAMSIDDKYIRIELN